MGQGQHERLYRPAHGGRKPPAGDRAGNVKALAVCINSPDPKSRSTLEFCDLHYRSIGVQNWADLLFGSSPGSESAIVTSVIARATGISMSLATKMFAMIVAVSVFCFLALCSSVYFQC